MKKDFIIFLYKISESLIFLIPIFFIALFFISIIFSAQFEVIPYEELRILPWTFLVTWILCLAVNLKLTQKFRNLHRKMIVITNLERIIEKDSDFAKESYASSLHSNPASVLLNKLFSTNVLNKKIINSKINESSVKKERIEMTISFNLSYLFLFLTASFQSQLLLPVYWYIILSVLIIIQIGIYAIHYYYGKNCCERPYDISSEMNDELKKEIEGKVKELYK